MAAKVHENTHARSSAVAVLYSSDITETPVSQIVETGAYPAEDFDLPPVAFVTADGQPLDADGLTDDEA